MNEIKDIELEILNLGRNPESEKLTKMIDKMDEFVNNKASIHPLLKPENLSKSIQNYRLKREIRDLDHLQILKLYTKNYCESCQNFILRNGDEYWIYVEPEIQKRIEFRILTCIQGLKSQFFDLGFILSNLNSLKSISEAEPEYDKIESHPYLNDSDIEEIINEGYSATKTIAILQLSGLLNLMKKTLNTENPSDLAKILSLSFQHSPGTLRRVISDLQTQLNGIGDVRNTAFTLNQKDFIEKTVSTLKEIGLSEQDIRSRIPPGVFGDE